MKQFFLIFFCLVVSLWATPAEKDSSRSFHDAFLALEGGAIYPNSDLGQVIDRSYYGLAEFRYSYFGPFFGVVQFGYAYMNTTDDVAFPGVHQFNGRVGIDYPIQMAKPISIGGGFSCIWARADGPDEDTKTSTLYDNESEFGWYLRLDLPIVRTQNYRVGAKVYYETLWTLPNRSNMLWIGFYVERKLW